MPRPLFLALLGVAAALALIAVATTSGGEIDGLSSSDATVPALADPIPYDGRSPRLASGGSEQRVLVELPRPALGERRDLASLDAAARIAYVKSLEREARALRSALEARGVRLRDVVTFERAWHGFAATVAARDVARLAELRLRTRPLRRFFPATSEPVPLPGPAATGTRAHGAASGPTIALLAGGVTPPPEAQDGLAPGYDAVDRDGDPAPERDPRDVRRTASSGPALLEVLMRAGRRVMPIRVSALRADATGAVEEFATTAELLAGLERAVDPDGDGDPSDHAAVALVALNAPYAGFGDAPEARAAGAAARLGTLVVAPGGHEGPARGVHGTVGSPGAARSAVAVSALSAPAAVPRAELAVEGIVVRSAALLGGAPPRAPLTAAVVRSIPGPRARLDPQGLGVHGRAAIVPAGIDAPARAAAAAAAGAQLVILAEPRRDRPLPAMPAGRVRSPVVGLTGAAAAAVLRSRDGARVRVGEPRAPALLARARQAARDGVPFGAERISPFASRGSAHASVAKPDLARPGTVIVGWGGRRVVAGTAVAAASVAIDAARLASRRPPVGAVGVRGRLLAGAGAVRRAARPGRPPRAPAPEPVPLAGLRLEAEGGRTSGIRFSAGRFDRGDPAGGTGTLAVPVERLELTLETDRGDLVRRLTPPGGERGLLPGEYAYTLPPGVLGRLDPGRYRFRVRARAPRQRGFTVALSDGFAVSGR